MKPLSNLGMLPPVVQIQPPSFRTDPDSPVTREWLRVHYPRDTDLIESFYTYLGRFFNGIYIVPEDVEEAFINFLSWTEPETQDSNS